MDYCDGLLAVLLMFFHVVYAEGTLDKYVDLQVSLPNGNQDWIPLEGSISRLPSHLPSGLSITGKVDCVQIYVPMKVRQIVQIVIFGQA